MKNLIYHKTLEIDAFMILCIKLSYSENNHTLLPSESNKYLLVR